jgi:FkbM family methyltransferase
MSRIKQGRVSYAQNREDIILAGFFEDDYRGFYVDIGANSPVVDSVTNLFYLRGWQGINIEPIKRHYDELVSQRPRDININVGVGNNPGTAIFREYVGDGLSTFSETMRKGYEAKSSDVNVAKFVEYPVAIDTLSHIFTQQAVQIIDFMKIDVEGFEDSVIEGNDWDRYRPKVLCIEANHIGKDWHPRLRAVGYELVFHDGLNEYYTDSRMSPKLRFDYVKSVIGADYVPYRTYLEFSEKEQEIKRLRIENEHNGRKIAADQAQINLLNAHILQSSRMRSIIRSLILKIHDIIVMRLTHNLGAKKQYPDINNLSLFSRDPQEIIEAIHQADIEVFLRRPSMWHRSTSMISRIIYYGYIRSVYFLHKVMRRAVRIIKRGRST